MRETVIYDSPFAASRMAPLVAFRDLNALCDTLVVGRWEWPAATAPGIFVSPPALNLNGREATLEKGVNFDSCYKMTLFFFFFFLLQKHVSTLLDSNFPAQALRGGMDSGACRSIFFAVVR